jgi:hypothetical protein
LESGEETLFMVWDTRKPVVLAEIRERSSSDFERTEILFNGLDDAFIFATQVNVRYFGNGD